MTMTGLLLCLMLSAQSAPPEPTFRTTTKLIQVNVIAKDKHGHPVTDLRKEEFELLDNGTRQPLAVFLLEDAARSQKQKTDNDLFTNQLTLADGARSGYTVILLDWLNTSWADQAQARRQTLRMLGAIGQQDRVALYVLGRELRIVHEFTGDVEELRGMIAAERGVATPEDPGSSSMVDASIGPSWLDSGISPQSFSRQDQFFVERRVLDTLQAFEAIAAHLAAVPGRKSLIWVSGGFPTVLGAGGRSDPAVPGLPGGGPSTSRSPTQIQTFSQEMNRMFARLNDADIAVYPIDARGLLVSSKAWTNIATMQELAHRTGGQAYYNRNDLDVAMRSALDDVRISYTLGYYAPATGGNGAHRIRVIVHRPGVAVRHRREYGELPVVPAKQTAGMESDRRRAWASPVDASTLSIKARAIRTAGELELRVLIDPATLALPLTGNRRAGKVDIVAGFRAADGGQTGSPVSRTLVLNMLEQTYQKALKEGLMLNLDLPIPADASSVRLLVSEKESSNLGTLTIPLKSVRTGK